MGPTIKPVDPMHFNEREALDLESCVLYFSAKTRGSGHHGKTSLLGVRILRLNRATQKLANN